MKNSNKADLPMADLPTTQYTTTDLIGQSVYCEKHNGQIIQGRIVRITWANAGVGAGATKLFPILYVQDDSGTITPVLHDEIIRL